MENNITTLRDVLFNTLTALNDKDNPMDIDRAKAVSEVAQVIINSAKVEVEHAKHTGSRSSTNFIPQEGIKPVAGGGYVHKLGQRGSV